MPASSEMEVGFAKLQGECFEYYMQTYSIILGRHSRRGSRKDPTAPAPAEADDGVDVDLGALGGGMNVSRRHARIFYDFPRRRFALQVLGKNGCLVEGVHHLPGSPPRQARLPGPPADGGRQVLLPPPVPLRLRRKRRAPAIPRSIPPPPSDDDEDNGKEQGEALAAAKYLSNGNDGIGFVCLLISVGFKELLLVCTLNCCLGFGNWDYFHQVHLIGKMAGVLGMSSSFYDIPIKWMIGMNLVTIVHRLFIVFTLSSCT
jgi:hypothetical protein